MGGVDDKVSEMTLEDSQPSVISKVVEADNDDDDDDDEEAADMEAFEVSGMLDEQDKVYWSPFFVKKCSVYNYAGYYLQFTEAPKEKVVSNKTVAEGDIIRTRTYDLHITYDKYYQTPRLWLFGYDEVRFRLSDSFSSFPLSEKIHSQHSIMPFLTFFLKVHNSYTQNIWQTSTFV